MPAPDLDELGRQAKLHHERIVTRAKEAAQDYWLLGSVLLPARPRFKKGEWYAWLKSHTVSRHRADRARLLAAAFGSPAALAELTVEEALALAKRKRPPAARKLAKQLRRRLREMAKTIERIVDEAACLSDERAGLATAAQGVRQALEAALRDWSA